MCKILFPFGNLHWHSQSRRFSDLPPQGFERSTNWQTYIYWAGSAFQIISLLCKIWTAIQSEPWYIKIHQKDTLNIKKIKWIYLYDVCTWQVQAYTKIIPLACKFLQHILVRHNKYTMCWNVGVVQFITTTSRRHSTGIKCHPSLPLSLHFLISELWIKFFRFKGSTTRREPER